MWADSQHQNNKLHKLFYVLPFQASLNAMYARLEEVFPNCVSLLHSRSLLALYKRLMERDYGPEKARNEAKWARNLAKLKFHPVMVFSPYQMLKAAFQLKGYETLLADFAGAAFIFDEVHCYEPDRMAMILEFTRYLHERFKSKFLFMSATLPTMIQNHLRNVLNTSSIIVASSELQKECSRHIVHVVEGDLQGSLDQMANFFAHGKSVLVVCNTVKRAQQAYLRLKEITSTEDIVLIHGRFNARDRLEKERIIKTATGLDSPLRHPIIVVSTQVVEVSLNIDLDVLFSDPAPLEALFQRLGRINRKKRIPFAQAYVFTEPVKQYIYDDELILAAVNVLRNYVNGKPVDESRIQGWLDEIYSNKILEVWQETFIRRSKGFRQAFLDTLVPFQSDEVLVEKFDEMFDGVEILPASLHSAYIEKKEMDPILSAELLVPIHWSQFADAKKKGLVKSRPGQWPPVIDLPYNQEFGLQRGPNRSVAG
ncbi:CRISPR-associated helicase Cas3' [bacterium]|nr:CRISPR-associated helicase Cas3' [bacterium]